MAAGRGIAAAAEPASALLAAGIAAAPAPAAAVAFAVAAADVGVYGVAHATLGTASVRIHQLVDVPAARREAVFLSEQACEL